MEKKEDKRVLVAYFSYSGTTERVAQGLSERTGADLFEIAPQEEYTDVYSQSNSEIRKNERPALSGTIENMSEYDIVFVGYPVWWHATPAPVNSFLESYDLSGKLIIPFCTSGGSDIEETLPTFLDSCDGLAVYGAKRIGGTSEIDAWIEELNLNLTLAKHEQSQEESVKSDANEQQGENGELTKNGDGRILVVYFSWSGNTEEMASYIAERVDGDLYEIEPETPYPTDYEECGDVAQAERDENARPLIANLPDSLDAYDTILVGYPIWWHTAPMIIGTFLETYDLSGKEIYPFSQSASMNEEQFENSVEFVRENAAGATVSEGLFVRPSNETEIDAYLSENGLMR